MDYPYSTFMSPLDSLVFENLGEPTYTDNDAAEELALWSNAQFTFDVAPGSGILGEDKTCSGTTTPALSASTDLDPLTYEKLVNYLDYELPRQQEQQQEAAAPSASHAMPAPTMLVPEALSTLTAAPPAVRQPMLLPKPPASDASQIATLLGQQQSMPAPVMVEPSRKKSGSTKHFQSANNTPDEIAAAEEDKRRRNTAASARFRIKKKLREQAMEQTVRDMTAKSEALQARVNELEKEVQWLRGLLIEKNKVKEEPQASEM